jgi:hypothetical protein
VSGTPNVKPPKNDQELARSFNRRIESVENPVSMRVGDWVLSTSESGALIASNSNGGSTVLAFPPAGEENLDPDQITDSSVPLFKARLGLPFTVPGSTVVAVPWDTVDFSLGDWGGSTSDVFTAVTVPKDGRYLIIGKAAWAASTIGVRKAVTTINGSGVDADEMWPYNNSFVTNRTGEAFDLLAGDAIGMNVYSSDAGQVLSAPGPDPLSFTSLSIVYLG